MRTCKMRPYRLGFLLMLVMAWPAWPLAAENFPVLRYGDTVVHPDCVLQILVGSKRTENVDLRRCASKKKIDAKILAEEGIARVDYPERADGMFAHYNSYQLIGTIGDLHFVLARQQEGGSMQYSSVSALRINDHHLDLVEIFDVGDRCNGGIHSAEFRDGFLVYRQYLTPYDLIVVGDENSFNLRPYVEMENSAQSCVAYAIAMIDPQKMAAELLGIRLIDPVRNDVTKWTAQFTYQPCFNDLYRQVKTERENPQNLQAIIDIKELNELVHRFYASCLPQDTKPRPGRKWDMIGYSSRNYATAAQFEGDSIFSRDSENLPDRHASKAEHDRYFDEVLFPSLDRTEGFSLVRAKHHNGIGMFWYGIAIPREDMEPENKGAPDRTAE